MPDITALKQCLRLRNDFIYFCAGIERFGYHEFAATLAEHNKTLKNIRIDK
jgi:UPF0755 protein